MTCVGLKRVLLLLAPLALVVANPAKAVVIPAYFGWNYVVDSLGAGAPPVMELTGFTYTGGAGAGLVMAIPAFPAATGMPDGVGLAAIPTFTTAAGGDGETTRTIGAMLGIDWVPAGVAAPYLLAPVPFPTIGISSFTVSLPGGAPFGNYVGFPPNAAGTPDYIVGLIPAGANSELLSFLGIPQGDVYGPAAGIPGNPTLGALNALAPGDLLTVIFAAATIPEPGALGVTGFALLGLAVVAMKRRRSPAASQAS